VSDIATSLNRDPSEITKFFGFELGAQTTMNVDEDRYIVNGAHSMNDLQQLVHKYIELFVLCKNCHLPETHYKIKGGGISQKCVACGSKDLCDMTHKLTTFISKQHKKMKEGAAAGEEGGGTGSKKKDKKEKKSKSGGGGEESAASASAAAVGGGGEDGEEGTKKKEKKSKKKKVVEEEEEVAGEALEGDTEREALGMSPSRLSSRLLLLPVVMMSVFGELDLVCS
jgi:translation initiation factor 5